MEMWNYLRCGGNGIGLKRNRRMLFGIELLVTTIKKTNWALFATKMRSKGILNEWCSKMMMDWSEFCKKML